MRRATRLTAMLMLAGCAHTTEPVPPVIEKPIVLAVLSDAEARAVTERFVNLAEQRDFAAAFSMLSGPLRERYTPERLGRDFDAEPLAKERLARIRAALGGPFTMTAQKAVLPLGAEKAFTLLHDGSTWRVVSLE